MMDGLAAWLMAHGQELILSAMVGLEKTNSVVVFQHTVIAILYKNQEMDLQKPSHQNVSFLFCVIENAFRNVVSPAAWG